MHSPKNCMPGAGWTPVSTDLVSLADGSRVNRYVVEKPGDRALMLYWYQERGKVIASEYEGKFQLIASTIVSGRRDGAIIRVLRATRSRVSTEQETAVVREFADAIRPVLPEFVPE
jgi:EpsI family protein